MKKIITITLALLLILSMAAPAQALTYGGWDWDAAQESIDRAAEQAYRNGAIYIPAEHTESWPDWLHEWLGWWATMRE